MAVGFPLYRDADVLGPLVDALRSAGWDLVRAVDLYPQGEDDLVHFRGLVTWEKDHEPT